MVPYDPINTLSSPRGGPPPFGGQFSGGASYPPDMDDMPALMPVVSAYPDAGSSPPLPFFAFSDDDEAEDDIDEEDNFDDMEDDFEDDFDDDFDDDDDDDDDFDDDDYDDDYEEDGDYDDFDE
jgi:hypothetical protein